MLNSPSQSKTRMATHLLIGATVTLLPATAYLVTRLWMFALLSYPWTLAIGIASLVSLRQKRWLLAGCLVAIPAAFGMIKVDVALLERHARVSSDAFHAAGSAAVVASERECPTLSDSLVGTYRCDVRPFLATDAQKLASEVWVLASEDGRRRVLFMLRSGSRMVVAYVPNATSYPCEELARDVYLCGFR